MSKIERVGITIEKELLPAFDALIAAEGYTNRSKAICDLIRERLSQKQLSQSSAYAVAGVFLIYDHHETKLSQKLVGLQHNHLLEVIASTHVHLDHHNCLEVIMLRGKVMDIEKLGNNITSLKGVKLSRMNMMAIEA
ncbi:MAG: nickel-responsive transcriptional regulator NikR [Phycisphaerae bacterium]|jgi:CopG family nickel-responsive transcriptional regulator